MTSIPVFNGSVTQQVLLPPDITARAMMLPDEPCAYFIAMPGQRVLPVSGLVLSHYRPDGVANAVEYMRAAGAGEMARRAPIDVEAWGEGKWLVTDGNSTASVAIAAGWSTLPAIVRNAC